MGIKEIIDWVCGKPKETLRCPRCANALDYKVNNKKSTLTKAEYFVSCPVCGWRNYSDKKKNKRRKRKKF